jgi:AGZA family xanthine/uracil permease-like MFS transporter
MFIVVFVIMLPIAGKTGDPVKGWEAGLTWVFVQSFVLMAGGFIAPLIRRVTPRAALLGALAGVSIAFISMRPALDMYLTPVIGLVCFAILIASWFGGMRYYKGMPAGLVAIIVGSAIAWGSTALGFNFGGMTLANLTGSFSSFGFSLPLPAIGHVFSGFEFLGVILVTAIPFGIYDLVEAMDNVESAAAGGDNFPTTRVLTCRRRGQPDRLPDGQPVHQRRLHRPSGLESDRRAHRLFGRHRRDGAGPVVVRRAGVVDGADSRGCDLADPALHRDADRRAGIPGNAEEPCAGSGPRAGAQVAAWGKLMIDNSLGAAGTNAAAIGMEKLGQVGVLYHGLEVLGGGAILVSLILAAIAASMIDRAFVKAAAFAMAGAALTFSASCTARRSASARRRWWPELSRRGRASVCCARHATAESRTAAAYRHETAALFRPPEPPS